LHGKFKEIAMDSAMETIFTGTLEKLAGNDDLMVRLMELNRACPFLDRLSRDELLNRMWLAEVIMQEELNVMAGCRERLKLTGA